MALFVFFKVFHTQKFFSNKTQEICNSWKDVQAGASCTNICILSHGVNIVRLK